MFIFEHADKKLFIFEDADKKMFIFENADKNCLYLKMLIKIVSRRARRRHYWLRRSQR